jgi:hypothetical protein
MVGAARGLRRSPSQIPVSSPTLPAEAPQLPAPPPVPEPAPSKSLGEQVDEFVEHLTSGVTLPHEHRDKLLQALRVGLEADARDLGTEPKPAGEDPREKSGPETAVSIPDSVPKPAPTPLEDPDVLQRQEELRAKDVQIELLESKVRRLALLLRERERRTKEVEAEAARSRLPLPGLTSRRTKSQPIAKEGTSNLMNRIRELNRQIREDIRSLYPEGAGAAESNGDTPRTSDSSQD